MSATDLAAVIVAAASVVAVVLLAVALVALVRTLKALRQVAELRAETTPLLTDLRTSADEARQAMETARDDLDRFDRVLGSACGST